MSQRKISRGISLPEDLWEKIDEAAREECRNPSQVLAVILSKYFGVHYLPYAKGEPTNVQSENQSER